MKNRFQTLGAAAFALIAVTVSSTAVYNTVTSGDTVLVPPMLGSERLLTGQVSTGNIPINEFTPEETAAGILLPADAHNFFSCDTGGSVSTQRNDLDNVRTWVYEFTGNEPPFDGKFFISYGELLINPQYDSLDTLQFFSEGKRYYQMGAEDLRFKCGEGISLNEYCGDRMCQDNENALSCAEDCNVCGDGVVFGQEECDDNNGLDGDGCDVFCRVEVGYSCNEGQPSSCQRLIPTLSGGDDAGLTGGTQGAPGPGPGPGPVSCPTLMGDTNLDGRVTSMDLLRLTDALRQGQHSFSDEEFACSDMDGDGLLTASDLNAIVNILRQGQSSQGNSESAQASEEPDAISLHSATLDGEDNLTVAYSKNFDTCAHIKLKPSLLNPFGSFDQKINFICAKGENQKATANQSLFNDTLSAGDEIKICHGNNGNLCSAYVTVTGTTPSADTGNLFINTDAQPLRNRQLLGGTLGEAVLRLEFYAEGEAIDVTDIRFSVDFETSVDRLELFTEGAEDPFAMATLGGCGNDTGGATNIFCANMEAQQFVVPAGNDMDIIVRPRMKTDEQGGESGQPIQVALVNPNSTVTAVEARGDESANTLAQNDGDTDAEGEIFIGTDIPGPNASQYPEGPLNVSTLAKIVSITNANPDANGTGVPTGISAIGQFKFTAAAHQNSKNGNNDVVLDSIVFNINASNVVMDAYSFAFYNKADQTKTTDCEPHYSTGEAFASSNISGSFTVLCEGVRVSTVDSEIDQGTDSTFVLEADITNPLLNPSGASVLQVSLQNFTDVNGEFGVTGSHIRWRDIDQYTNVYFDWIEYPETTIKSTSYNS